MKQNVPSENTPAEPASQAKPQHLFGHGRLSYIQIPAKDVQRAARFYEKVFGWRVRGGCDDHLSFTDATGDMIGAWVTGCVPSAEPGILPYIYVFDIKGVLERIKAVGAEIIKPLYPEGDLWVATFRDPAGNVIGVWQRQI